MNDTEYLQFIHEAARMGIQGLEDVKDHVSTGGMQAAIAGQLGEYREISAAAGSLLRSRGEKPKEPGLMARLSSGIMSTAKTMADSSPSAIAEMIIQGNNMGIVKSIKHLHDYDGDSRPVRALADKLLKTEEANVEQMKPFL